MPFLPAVPGRIVTPKRKRAHLSRILDRHLGAYALAAGAAGVSVAATVQAPTQNSIVYTPANIQFAGEAREDMKINIDLNGDGITDVIISADGSGGSFGSANSSYYFGGAGWSGASGGGGIEAPLGQGAEIGPERNFAHGGPLLHSTYQRRHHRTENRCRGPFRNLTAYLGVEFQISGEVHYGWVRLTTACQGLGSVAGTVTGYAYNTVAGMPIRAGQTSDVAGDSETPSTDAAAPATLGALGLGSQGLTLWRRDSK